MLDNYGAGYVRSVGGLDYGDVVGSCGRIIAGFGRLQLRMFSQLVWRRQRLRWLQCPRFLRYKSSPNTNDSVIAWQVDPSGYVVAHFSLNYVTYSHGRKSRRTLVVPMITFLVIYG